MRKMLGVSVSLLAAASLLAAVERPAGACSVYCGRVLSLTLIEVVSADGSEAAPPTWPEEASLTVESDGLVSSFRAGELDVALTQVSR
jgi:hypothetical protein